MDSSKTGEDWRSGMKSNSERNNYILEHTMFTDCAFKVGLEDSDQIQVFRCHKSTLASHSPVFEAMFFGVMAETASEIRVTDVKPDIFKLLLTYIYTEEMTFSDVTRATEVASVADKYMVTSLKEKMISCLVEHANISNVLYLLHVNDTLLHHPLLSDKCFQIVREHTKYVINQHEFLLASQDVMCQILDQPTLNCVEYELVMSAERWARHQLRQRGSEESDDNLRECLLPLIPRMRLLTLSQIEIESGPDKWLTQEERDFISNPARIRDDSTKLISESTSARLDEAVWVSAANGDVPDGAVRGGSDHGCDLYIARAMHEGDLIPGKFVPSHRVAYVGCDGDEHTKYEYEILCGCKPKWVQVNEGGEIPSNALPAGRTVDGETLFIGRAPHMGTLTLGKVDPSFGRCFIPYGGDEIGYPDYEILVR